MRDSAAKVRSRGREGFDALNRASQLRALIDHDVPEPYASIEEAAERVESRTLVVVASRDHMVHPGPALDFAARIGARTLVLESDCGHSAPGCEAQRFTSALREFLESSR